MSEEERTVPADDPFDGIVLDDDFVRAATRHEAAHPLRHGLPPAVPAPALSRDSPRQRRRRNPHFGVLVVAIAAAAAGAGVMVVGHRADSSAGVQAPLVVDKHDSGSKRTPDVRGPRRDTSLADQSYARGACYTWPQLGGATDAEKVTCNKPHLFQAVAQVTLPDSLGAGFPSEDQWSQIARQRCGPLVAQFLGFPLAPDGRWFAEGIHPLAGGWSRGHRDLQCGISASTPLGQPPLPGNMLPAFSGVPVRDHQQWYLPPGTCVAEPPFRIVPCRLPHNFVVAGTKSIAPDAVPGTGSFSVRSHAVCATTVGAYPHATTAGQLRAVPTVIPPSLADWQAGLQSIICVVGYADILGGHQVTGPPAAPQPVSGQ